jgi:repressor LexA
MKREMSDVQSQILAFIEEYSRREGCPPTNREIGHKVNIKSTGHVDYHLTVLERKGYIQRERRKSRGIRMANQEPAGLRMYGAIAAGQPLDIYTDQQDPLDLGIHTREYVLLVKGSSMIDDGINDGDYVLVLPAVSPNDGDIIVATHMTEGPNGAATLKRFYRERENDRMRLQPANSTMDPIYVSSEEWDNEWEIQGKVTAVYRKF